MNWPADADGDVLRRLKAKGFDFGQSHQIDFNIGFDSWPPPEQAMAQLRNGHARAAIARQIDDEGGYLLFRIEMPVTYDAITGMQARLTQLMAPFGGRCETWGVAS